MSEPRGPTAPVVGVGGVAVQDGRVALIRRGKPPLAGRWTLPGGTVELGESLEQALVREMFEETGLCVRPTRVLKVFDRIQRTGSRVEYHYVIVDYWCEVIAGPLRAGSDAADAAWVAREDLERYDVPSPALELVLSALAMPGSEGLPAVPAASHAQEGT